MFHHCIGPENDLSCDLGKNPKIRGTPTFDPWKRGLGGSKKIDPPHVTYLGPK